jgi:nucleoside-diphosphate-sugar epimerase
VKVCVAGAAPVVCDALDADALRAAVVEAAPEVVVHELTALPVRLNYRRRGLYDATNRLRAEGTANLLAAAKAAGARRFVCQSVAFAYAPGDEPDVKAEDAPLFTDAPPPFGDGVRVIAEMERSVLEADGLDGLVLRYGWFYGPGTYLGDGGSTAQDVRRRRFPLVGDGTGMLSFVHIDDAAAATVAAVERGAPGVYNVVDDEPAAMRDWLPVYAEAIGAKRPLRIPVWLARIVAGPMGALVNSQPAAANARAKRELDWAPRWPSWRQGFSAAPR